MSFAAADRIARAVLYEGYALYPYRPSSLKNQQRWTFGGLFPPGGVGEPSRLRCEVLLRGEPTVEVRLRFLQLFGGQAMEREVTAPGPFSFSAVDGGAALQGRIALSVIPAADAFKVSVTVENTGDNAQPELQSFASPHVLLHAPRGELVSMTDPPPELAAAAAECKSEVVWPVLLSRDLVLGSPIILEDFPRIAPESAGDLFDSSEIDEILVLRILTLTDAEKREARADPKVAALLDRVEALTDAQRAQLHGTLRSAFRRGEKVRIHPSARADVFDVALRGKVATVADLERFVDGSEYCVVTVDDDPGAHRLFFRPDELERA